MIYANNLKKCYFPNRQSNYCVKNDGDNCPKLAVTLYGFCGAECIECGGEIIYKKRGLYFCNKCSLKIREI